MQISINNNSKKIIAVVIGVLPFYVFAIVDKIINQQEFSIKVLFLFYLPIATLVLGILYLLNRFFLKQKISGYNLAKTNYLLDIAVILLLMVGSSLINITAKLFLNDIFPNNYNNSKILEVLKTIFANPFYAFIFLIPFTWITHTFLVFSKIFLLKNLWDISANKVWIWSVIILSTMFFTLTEIDKGMLDILVSFSVGFLFAVTYLYYRRFLPLIIAAILTQTIQMLDFWISFSG